MRSIRKVKNKNDKSKETTIKERKARIPYQTDLTNNFYTKSNSDDRIEDGTATAACSYLDKASSPAVCQVSVEGFHDKIEASSSPS